MTENKRYYRDFSGDNGTIIRDRTIDGELGEVFEFGLSDSKDLCELLNEQDERIKELEEELASFEEVNFTNNCDGTNTVLYKKIKEDKKND